LQGILLLSLSLQIVQKLPGNYQVLSPYEKHT
jgi:hypothetical protein